MNQALSSNEREALSRFLAKIIEDVEKVAVLLEGRGSEAVHPRTAERELRRTLDQLQSLEDGFEIGLPSTVTAGAGVGYNRVS